MEEYRSRKVSEDSARRIKHLRKTFKATRINACYALGTCRSLKWIDVMFGNVLRSFKTASMCSGTDVFSTGLLEHRGIKNEI